MLSELLLGIAVGIIEMLVIISIWIKFDVFSIKEAEKREWALVIVMGILTVGMNMLLLRQHGSACFTLNILTVYVIMSMLAGIDFKKKMIPNSILAVGFVIRTILLLWEWIAYPDDFKQTILSAAAGFAFGLLFLLLLSFITRHGIGYGDVKLFAWIGYCVGLFDTYSILFYSALAAASVGIFLLLFKKAGRKKELPFAPFVYIGCYLVFYMLL